VGRSGRIVVARAQRRKKKPRGQEMHCSRAAYYVQGVTGGVARKAREISETRRANKKAAEAAFL
jgi:hypothetical protein